MNAVRQLVQVTSTMVSDVRKYLGSDMRYVPASRFTGPAALAWNDSGVAEAQRKHWPTLVRNLAGPGPLGVAIFHGVRPETIEVITT
jgi:hypothetical protein